MSDSENSKNFDCNISEKECKKSKKYKRDDINEIAEACGIKDPIKIKSRDKLCDLIIAKKQGKTIVPDSPKRAKAPNKGIECNKETLENCTILQLKTICSAEGIEKCNKNKDDLIKYILKIRKNRKQLEEEDSEEEDDDKKITKQLILKLLKSLGSYNDISTTYLTFGDIRKKIKELLEKQNYKINDDNKKNVKQWIKENIAILEQEQQEQEEEDSEDEEPIRPPSPKKTKFKKTKGDDCDEENLENCKIAELIDICKKKSISGYSKYKAEGKNSLIEFIRQQLKSEVPVSIKKKKIPTISIPTPPISPLISIPTPPISPLISIPTPPISPPPQIKKTISIKSISKTPKIKMVEKPLSIRKKIIPPEPIIIPAEEEPILARNSKFINQLLLSQSEKPFTFITDNVSINEPEKNEDIFNKRDMDIDDILSDLQIPSKCNPLNNKYCDSNYNCDINSGRCINKDINIPSNYSTIEINGHSIIGTIDTIEKLNKELKNINLPLLNQEFVEPPTSPFSKSESSFIEPPTSPFQSSFIEPPISPFQSSFIEPPTSPPPSFKIEPPTSQPPFESSFFPYSPSISPPESIINEEVDIIEDDNYLMEPPISSVYKINDVVLLKEGVYKNSYGRINYIDDLNGELGIIPIGENSDNLAKYYYFKEDISEPIKDFVIEEEEEEEEEKPLPKKPIIKNKFSPDLLKQLQDIPDDELGNIDIANNITLQCLGLLA